MLMDAGAYCMSMARCAALWSSVFCLFCCGAAPCVAVCVAGCGAPAGAVLWCSNLAYSCHPVPAHPTPAHPVPLCCSNYNMKMAPAEWWVEDGQKLTKIRRGVTLEVR